MENLSGKIEYDFYGFGTKNYNFGFTPISVRSNLHTLIVGLNYRFNWSGGPSHSRRIPLPKQGRSRLQALGRRSGVAPCRSRIDRTFAGNSAFDALAKVQRSHYVR